MKLALSETPKTGFVLSRPIFFLIFQTFVEAVSSLHPAPTDSCPLWLNNATVAALPVKCSRHNTPSRAHSLAKLVKSCLYGGDEFVVVSTSTY